MLLPVFAIVHCLSPRFLFIIYFSSYKKQPQRFAAAVRFSFVAAGIRAAYCFLHLLKPLNICHEQSCAADLDFLVLSLLGAGLAVAVYQLDRMGELVVVNADEQSHVAAAQESAGGRDLP